MKLLLLWTAAAADTPPSGTGKGWCWCAAPTKCSGVSPAGTRAIMSPGWCCWCWWCWWLKAAASGGMPPATAASPGQLLWLLVATVPCCICCCCSCCATGVLKAAGGPNEGCQPACGRATAVGLTTPSPAAAASGGGVGCLLWVCKAAAATPPPSGPAACSCIPTKPAPAPPVCSMPAAGSPTAGGTCTIKPVSLAACWACSWRGATGPNRLKVGTPRKMSCGTRTAAACSPGGSALLMS